MNGLSAVLSDFDYVLFDMGAGLSNEQLPFILSAEDILAVTTPEPTIMDAYSAIKHLLLADERLTVNIAVNRARSQNRRWTRTTAFLMRFTRFRRGSAFRRLHTR